MIHFDLVLIMRTQFLSQKRSKFYLQDSVSKSKRSKIYLLQQLHSNRPVNCENFTSALLLDTKVYERQEAEQKSRQISLI